MSDRGYYELPGALSRHITASGPYRPGELQEICRQAGEDLGQEDAALAEFRSAAEMISLWQDLDLPA